MTVVVVSSPARLIRAMLWGGFVFSVWDKGREDGQTYVRVLGASSVSETWMYC